jgi:hypothetical protein
MKKFCTAMLFLLMSYACVFADQIVLKDDQKFEADVKSFDSYYVLLELPNRRQVSIPWSEVRLVKHTTTASSWLEETYMNNDDVEVTSMIVPLNEGEAFQKAIFPGLIMHGSGHFYAKEQNAGFSLLSAEILSLVMMGISVNELLTPVAQDQSFNVSRAVFFTGLTMFVGSWLWDIAFSPKAVADYNERNKFLMNEPAGEAPAAATTTAAGGVQDKPAVDEKTEDKKTIDGAGNTQNIKQEIK